MALFYLISNFGNLRGKKSNLKLLLTIFFLIIVGNPLKRVDFTLWLVMFVTAQKERELLINLVLSSFCCPRGFKLG